MIDNKLIYDVGAHKGEDTELYLKKGFAVVAIEAVPDLCVLLEQKFSRFVQDGQLKILNVAVSKAAGPIDFYVDENVSIWGTANGNWVERNKALGEGKARKITVEARPLNDIIREYGVPRYCKIDIEGNDLEALKSLIGAPDAPCYISIESEKRDWGLLMEEFLTFRELGYSRYKVIDQSLVKLQQCPSPAREGNNCDHIFEDGSSGLFGDDLPGAWFALTEAVEAYRQIFRGYALNGDSGMFQGKYSILRLLARIQTKAILPPVAWYDTHAGR